MANGTSRKRQYKKRDVRKNKGSKRRSRRVERAKHRITTKRTMINMKGGAGKWECKCASSDNQDNQPNIQQPTEGAFASHMKANRLYPEEIARRQEIIEQERTNNSFLRTKLNTSDNLSLKTDIATRLAATRTRTPNPLNVEGELSRPTPPPHPYRRPPPPPEKVRSLLGDNMIRVNEKGKYQVDSREQLPYGFIDGDQIISINGETASVLNIMKLFNYEKGNRVTVDVVNNTGGTNPQEPRTITIDY